jgi:ATP-binding cassette subfamily B protein
MWQLWRPWRIMILPILLLTLLNAGLVVSIPLAVKHIFDSLGGGFSIGQLRHATVWLVTLGAGRFFVYCSLQNCRAFVWSRLEWTVRSRIFAHVTRLGPTFFGRYDVGDLVTRLTNDIGDDKFCWFLCPGLFRAFEATSIVVAAGVAMARLQGTLTLAVLLPLVAVFVTFVKLAGLLDRRFRALQSAISRVTSYLQATFDAIRLVFAYQMEASRGRGFDDILEQRREVDLEAIRGQVWMEITHSYAWQAVAALVLLLGGRMVLLGHITLGDWVAFNSFAFSLTVPIFDLGNLWVRGRQCLVCAERLRELENTQPDVRELDNPQPVRERNKPQPDVRQTESSRPEVPERPAAPHQDVEPELTLREVSFAYAGLSRDVLQQLSFEIRLGEFAAVAGAVGSGKSTLLRLLVRLADPHHGSVVRAGHDVRAISLAAVRDGVGLVPQDPLLFSDTIAENVRFGRAAVSDDDVAWALEVAHLQLDAAAFPQGLQTRVGPRGTQLSGGQKQRLSLARALAGRPRLLLLDDCTASLDSLTEARLWARLRSALPQATVVLVTHRLATLERADRVLVLGRDGRLLAVGTHGTLLADCAEYARLYAGWRDDSALTG